MCVNSRWYLGLSLLCALINPSAMFYPRAEEYKNRRSTTPFYGPATRKTRPPGQKGKNTQYNQHAPTGGWVTKRRLTKVIPTNLLLL